MYLTIEADDDNEDGDNDDFNIGVRSSGAHVHDECVSSRAKTIGFKRDNFLSMSSLY